MAYLAVLSATMGRRAGFAATAGVAFGLLIVGLGAALGLAAVISNSRWLYEALRWGGALYLLWLAWEGWRGEEETSPGKAGAAGLLGARAVRPRQKGRGCDGYAGACSAALGPVPSSPGRRRLRASLGTPSGSLRPFSGPLDRLAAPRDGDFCPGRFSHRRPL